MPIDPLITLLILIAVVLAVATIIARYSYPAQPVPLYIFKPLATISILAIAFIPAIRHPTGYGALIGLGLVFSLAGDIWLMLPADRFIPGLVSFLLAHVCYLVAFTSAVARPGSFLPPMAVLIAAILVLAYLWPGLSRGLRIPVCFYVGAIAAMAGMAVYRASAGAATGAFVAAVGALLFMASDSVLAINRFRRSFAAGQALSLGTYYAGQLLIALSVIFFQ
jgi:uncharacterized membrane protein YhhN